MARRRIGAIVAAAALVAACGDDGSAVNESGGATTTEAATTAPPFATSATHASTTTAASVSNTTAAPSASTGLAVPSDGSVRCTSQAGWSYLVPAGWYASGTPVPGEVLPLRPVVEVASTENACTSLTRAPSASRGEVTTRPGVFLITTFEAAAYEVWFTAPAAYSVPSAPDPSVADVVGLVLRSDLVADPIASISGTTVTFSPPVPVGVEWLTNAAGLQGILLTGVVDQENDFGGSLPVGATFQHVVVVRDGRPALVVSRSRPVGDASAVTAYEASIRSVFATLRW